MTKVTNMTSTNGNKVTNQFVLHDSNGDISLQSYDSLVCQIRKGGMGFDRVVCFGRDWDYSSTTVKYVNKFLKDNGLDVLAGTRNIREGIERGHARYDEAIAVLYFPTMH
jgi:hypothetical protein